MRKQLSFDAVSCPHVEVTPRERPQPRRTGRGAATGIDDALIAASMAGVTLFGALMIADLLRYI